MIAVPIRYRRVQRGQFIQKLQHAIPSIVVLGDGLTHVQDDPHGLSLALGAAEIAVSAIVIVLVIRGIRQLLKAAAHAPHDHFGVDWIDLSLGAMLMVEAYAKYHATHHIPRPTILLAVAMTTIGLLHGKLVRRGTERRMLRVTSEGVSLPKRPFSRLTLTWDEIAEIAIGPEKARVIAHDGREQAIDLADAMDAPALRAALEEARLRLDGSRIAAEALPE